MGGSLVTEVAEAIQPWNFRRNVRSTESVLGALRADGFWPAFETDRPAELHSTESKCQRTKSLAR